jgi:hypothetical protein
MSKDKSILERFTDTVKEMANNASEALKAEEPPKVEQTNAAYMPFAAEGLVSDPLLIPPVAAAPPRGKRTAKKAAKKSSARSATAKRAAPKRARNAAKASARGKSKVRKRHEGIGQTDDQTSDKAEECKGFGRARSAVVGSPKHHDFMMNDDY